MTPNPNPSPELQPCPFCGAGTATSKYHLSGVWVEKSDHDEPDYHVHCWSCGGRGNERGDREAAIAAWNTRALSPQTLPAPGEVERVAAAIFEASRPGSNVDPRWSEWVAYAEAHPAHQPSVELVRLQATAAVEALATVAAANDEGVYAQGRCDGYAAGRSHAIDDAATIAENSISGSVLQQEVVLVARIAAAIRLLSQGGGKA